MFAQMRSVVAATELKNLGTLLAVRSLQELLYFVYMDLARTRRLLTHGLRLRCPACGLGKLYRSFFQMRDGCDYCGLVFVREQGYFVGAIYLNVVATEFLIFSAYAALTFFLRVADGPTYTILFSLAFVLPLFFNRHARSLWLSLDYVLDPPGSPIQNPQRVIEQTARL